MFESRFLLIMLALAGIGIMSIDPALAGNKFQTISGGVVGSSDEKRLWTQIVLAALGGILLISAVAAVFLPHNNALFMNHLTWRSSAILMALFGGLALTGALLI